MTHLEHKALELFCIYIKAREGGQPTEKHYRNARKAWSRLVKAKQIKLAEAA